MKSFKISSNEILKICGESKNKRSEFGIEFETFCRPTKAEAKTVLTKFQDLTNVFNHNLAKLTKMPISFWCKMFC
jgi:hypothetical protein